MAELKKCPACGSEKGAPSFSNRAWGRKNGRCMECVQNKIEIPPRTISSLRVRTREATPSEDAADDAAYAVDAAFGRTALSAELLRVAGKVHGNMKGDPVGGLMTYCGENSLNSVDDVVVHYPEAAHRARETICDAEMAFSKTRRWANRLRLKATRRTAFKPAAKKRLRVQCFANLAFGRAPVEGEAPNGITDTRDSYHLDRTTAPRRRLVALCGALPASARRALGPCVVALRDACARCTYEMPFPENWNEESNDEY